MNRKYLFISIAIILVAAGATWIGRSVYRARHNLITIDVYNAPLATVIRQMEQQTRETILAGKGLEAKVTLAVKNMPLDQVLDRLGRQVGELEQVARDPRIGPCAE
jgi:type II secretory pathway component HofQ